MRATDYLENEQRPRDRSMRVEVTLSETRRCIRLRLLYDDSMGRGYRCCAGLKRDPVRVCPHELKLQTPLEGNCLSFPHGSSQLTGQDSSSDSLELDQFVNSFAITLSPVPYGVVAVASIVAAVTDACMFRVFNWVTIPLLVSGVAYHSFVPTAEGVWFTLVGGLVGLLILMPIYVVGGIGAGDVKLLAGIGSWLGVHDFFRVFVLATLLCGVFSIVLLLVTGTLRQRLRHLVSRSAERDRVEVIDGENPAERRKRFVPFASMTALAVLILLTIHSVGPDLQMRATQSLETHAQHIMPISDLPFGRGFRMGDT